MPQATSLAARTFTNTTVRGRAIMDRLYEKVEPSATEIAVSTSAQTSFSARALNHAVPASMSRRLIPPGTMLVAMPLRDTAAAIASALLM
jgi:hypothetical protein